MQSSLIILYSIPAFAVLMAIELAYGIFRGRNTYRLNDTFCSLTLGLLSRFPPVFKLGVSGMVYAGAANLFGIDGLAKDAWSTWVLAFLLYDFSYYWKHRLCHERTLLWASHVVHHQSEDYNLGTALRQTGSSFIVSWIFYIPMFLVGVPIEVFVPVAGVNLVYQFWVHTEHIGSLGLLDRIMVTPSNHRVHHARNAEYIDANYGGVFIIWDRIFGTFRAERSDLPPEYGTRTPLRSWNPLWANLEIYWRMLRDSWYTKNWRDKCQVWISRTGWRPDDVAAQFAKPESSTANYLKYHTNTSLGYQVFAVVQFLMCALVTLWVVLYLPQQSIYESVVMMLLVVVSAALTAEILKGNSLWIWLEVARSLAVLTVILVLRTRGLDFLVGQFLALHAVFNLLVIALIWAYGRFYLWPLKPN